ncbi:MAG TPA: PAS domain S-box protein [Methanomicrobiales archaeon]|nr:PAS domain S-box protein [Methanomicrobiales archaeon]
MHEVELLEAGPEGETRPGEGGGVRPRSFHVRAGREEVDSRVRQILWDHPSGLTVEEVSRAIGLGRSSTGRRLDALASRGEIRLHTYGHTRVFTVPREAGLESILSSSQPLLLVLSAGLRILGVNDPLLATFRLRREDLQGRPLKSTPLARYGEDLVASLGRSARERAAGEAEMECLIGDLHHVFRTRIMPLSLAAGRRGFVVTLEDVTRRAIHRRRLEGIMDEGTRGLLSSHPGLLEEILDRKRQEEQMQIVQKSVDQAPVPAFWVGRDGHFLRANRAAARMLGYGEEELARLAYPDVDAGEPPVAWDSLWETLKAGTSTDFESTFRAKRGDLLRVNVRASHLVHRGREYAFLIVEDITDRKRVEDATRQANERLNLLTTVTRHDVLNDIAALGMYLELPGTGSAREFDPGTTGRLQLLVRSMGRKMEFTRDYADLGMKMPCWEDVAGCVEQAAATLVPGTFRVDLDLPPLEVYADPLFERAIANLVDNTLRHGEHATRIGVRARVEGDGCTLIIEDDGAGVPPGMKEPIFRPGYGRHTGLGLFLVREILGITGMSIRETGEPGKGARFEIRIPPGGFRIRDGSGDTHGDTRIQAQG